MLPYALFAVIVVVGVFVVVAERRFRDLEADIDATDERVEELRQEVAGLVGDHERIEAAITHIKVHDNILAHVQGRLTSIERTQNITEPSRLAAALRHTASLIDSPAEQSTSEEPSR